MNRYLIAVKGVGFEAVVDIEAETSAAAEMEVAGSVEVYTLERLPNEVE